MNQDDSNDVAALASAWTVETTDLRGRVAAAIGAPSDMADLLVEMRAMRREMEELRHVAAVLRQELARARSVPVPRITPYAPTESLIRLS